MKKKLKIVTLIVSVVALVVSVMLGVTYFQQRPEKEALASELTAANATLNEQRSNAEERSAEETRLMEEQLAVAEARLAQEKLAVAEARRLFEEAYSSDKLSTGGVLKGILELAAQSQVNVVSTTTESQGDEKRGGQTYQSLSIDLQVAGSLSNLAAFISKLEDGPVKAVNISSTNIAGEGSSHIANLDLSVLYPLR